MHRNRIERLVILATVLLVLAAPSVAGAINLDDPNLFGPGEGWPTPSTIEYGDSGPWVLRLQQELTDAGFRPGRVDGRFGPSTRGAVYAFQKVHGLERDAVFRADDWDLLHERVSVDPVADEPDRVEVDLSKQVLYLIVDNSVEAILPVSSGSGSTYRGPTGAAIRATTPEGAYSFFRHVSGWRISYLGGLYSPFYFRGGYAIHGSWSVPPYPASHGCVRVEIGDMQWLTTQLHIGMPVVVYGNTVTRQDVLPGAEA